jgi:hypothetical protein
MASETASSSDYGNPSIDCYEQGKPREVPRMDRAFQAGLVLCSQPTDDGYTATRMKLLLLIASSTIMFTFKFNLFMNALV